MNYSFKALTACLICYKCRINVTCFYYCWSGKGASLSHSSAHPYFSGVVVVNWEYIYINIYIFGLPSA